MDMKIGATQVYGIKESIIRSSFPMDAEIELENIDYSRELTDADWKRAIKLGNAVPGSGHDCFLKGITVQADFRATGYWWQQWQRYHFADIISSQSKMHRITKMNLDIQCTHRVKQIAKDALLQAIAEFNADPSLGLEHVLDNAPGGLMLTAGIDTNYLQLKNMRTQRQTHRLKMWNNEFVNWIRSLPYFPLLCMGEAKRG